MDIQRSVFLSVGSTNGISFDTIIFIVMLICIFLSAFFSMSETAFSSANVVKLKSLVEDRKSGAKKALQLAEDFDKTVTTLLIGNNIVNTALSTVAVGFFIKLGIAEDWVNLISTLIITVVLLIFGEILPKTIAKNNPEAVTVKVAYIIYTLQLIFYPFVMCFRGLQRLVSKRHADDEKKTYDEEEFNILIDEMEESGTIEDDEANIIKNVLDLKERSVADLMVPRIDMVALNYASTLEEVKQFIMEINYSRIPVYKTDKDHIVGILYVRDFFPALVKNPRLSWKKLIRPVKFVSSQMKADDLIVELQKSKTMIAIVSGEYGDVAGLVTMEDALEELVGEIYDEHDIAGEDDILFTETAENTYLVDADMYVDDFFERLNIGDVPEDVPSKLSGWLFAKCESIPEVGFTMTYIACYTTTSEETEEYEDYAKALDISIAEVDDRRIQRVQVVVRDASEEEIEQYQKEDEE
ncbi:MAG: hemolysin family protein [Roseburia sp.]|nr:hemolysin family protein [Anaeroplasma bactoclasticum]MCM1196474.1 hemolysin family protein [Roseburia sp.]MCM1556513.1 hemolysin family protein [Anaeroplasma bactoclasticum]